MTFLEKINEDLKAAMRAGDSTRVSVFRMLVAGLRNREIVKRVKSPDPLTDEEVLEVVMSEAKKRKEAIEGFEKGGRAESAQKEREELKILEGYLPAQLSEAEVAKLIDEAIKGTGAISVKDMGKVLGYLASKLKGKADMSSVSRAVASRLAVK